MTQPDLNLYYSPGACSLAPHIMLEQAGAAYFLTRVAIAEGANLETAYLAVNPRGRVPALSVGGTVITENLALMTYIARRFPEARLIPIDDLAAARVYELLSFFAASVHVAFAQIWRMQRFSADPAAYDSIQAGGRAALLEYFDEIERILKAQTFIAGSQMTAADGYPFVFMRWARKLGFDIRRYPAWIAHTERALALPSFVQAVQQEGLAPSEFLPEPASANR
jgi:glutathione S-transferase